MKLPLIGLALSAAMAFAPVHADEALARSKSCMGCHAMDRKVVGPSFRDIGKRYAKDAGASALLATKIIKGSSKAWGVVDMPANPHVSSADAKKLADWIATLR